MRNTLTETLAQKLHPHLTPDIDQFDDDGLEMVVLDTCSSPRYLRRNP